MNRTHPSIAIVGASGAVGKALLSILEFQNFPLRELRLFSSPRSAGNRIRFRDQTIAFQTLTLDAFHGIDLAFFDASDDVSREWVPAALKAGAWVIDNSGVYRMNPEVPLVVPEINEREIQELARSGKPRLIAGPNCTTVQLVMALKPLHDCFRLTRVSVSTYQSVSGAGTLAMEELQKQTQAFLRDEPLHAEVLKHPIAFNCIPQIGSFDAEGFTSEEKKVTHETRKILGLPDLRVSCTAVRVPALQCHSESVSAEFERPVNLNQAREALMNFPGVELQDDPPTFHYPMNLTSADGDSVAVGRLRRDPSCENGLQLWVVSDNLRKGAALNAVQIARSILNLA